MTIFGTSENFNPTKYLVLLGLCFWRFFVRRFPTSCKTRNFFAKLKKINFSKRSKAAWDYRRDDTDHHCSSDCAQIKKLKIFRSSVFLGRLCLLFSWEKFGQWNCCTMSKIFWFIFYKVVRYCSVRSVLWYFTRILTEQQRSPCAMSMFHNSIYLRVN